MAQELELIWTEVLLGKGEQRTISSAIPAGFVGKVMGITRHAWERVTLIGIAVNGERTAVKMRRIGDDQYYVLPELDAGAERVLQTTWVNRQGSPVRIAFFVSPGVRPSSEPPVASIARPHVTTHIGAVPTSAQVTHPAHQLTPVMTNVTPAPAPAPPREPFTDVETQIAHSFGVAPAVCRGLAERVARQFNVRAAELLEFLTVDCRSTIEQSWLDQMAKMAERAGVPAGEMQLASVIQGAAVSVSERSEFDQLLAQAKQAGALIASEPTTGLGQDFQVSSVVHPAPAPTTRGNLEELAERMSVDPIWLKWAIKSIAELRALSPDALTHHLLMKTSDTIAELRYRLDAELKGYLDGPAPELPPGEQQSDHARYWAASESDRPELYRQMLGTRMIDALVRFAIATKRLVPAVPITSLVAEPEKAATEL